MNILVLTNVYPYENDTNTDRTKVVAYFARSWVKAGHRVVVIVNSSVFPNFFYNATKLIGTSIKKKLNISKSPNKVWNHYFEFDDQGACVINIPISKWIPHGRFSDVKLNRHADKIVEQLKNHSFVPDVISGHWVNPQLFLLPKLAKEYNVKTALVFHGDYKKTTCEKYYVQKYLNQIEKIGFRSVPAMKIASEYLDCKSKSFVAASGIPSQYIIRDKIKEHYSFSDDYMKIICVARLLPLKRVDLAIEAVINAFHDNSKYEFNIVGDGPVKDNLVSLIEKGGAINNIHLLGTLKRDEALELMAKSDVFVLLSDRETFGLVYLEALAKGCIVIASRGEGIDGIIIDGENGFLCDKGNLYMLSNIFERISNMTYEQKILMSKKAIETAREYTEDKVAERYLNNIL